MVSNTYAICKWSHSFHIRELSSDFFFPLKRFFYTTHRRDGAQSFLAAAFLMAAGMLLSFSLFHLAQMCVRTLFLMNVSALLSLDTLSSSMALPFMGTKPHTFWITSRINLVCLVRCPWRQLCSACWPCGARWGPWPCGATEPWLLLLSGCCGYSQI